jgi:hypothetical protein
MVPTASLYEDADNPRTEFPDAELDEIADDIRQHGILNLGEVLHEPAGAQEHRLGQAERPHRVLQQRRTQRAAAFELGAEAAEHHPPAHADALQGRGDLRGQRAFAVMQIGRLQVEGHHQVNAIGAAKGSLHGGGIVQ